MPSGDAAEYSGAKLVIFTAIFVPILIVCVVLRYLTRYLIRGPWGLDDWVVLASLMLQLSMAGVAIGMRSQFLLEIILMMHRFRQARRSGLPCALFVTTRSLQDRGVGQVPRRD